MTTKVRLRKDVLYRGLAYLKGQVLEVPTPTAERMENKGLAEPLVSGLILPESAKPKKGRKGTKRKRLTDY